MFFTLQELGFHQVFSSGISQIERSTLLYYNVTKILKTPTKNESVLQKPECNIEFASIKYNQIYFTVFVFGFYLP